MYQEAPDVVADQLRPHPVCKSRNVLRKIIDEKMASYDEYNNVTNPLFLRNMQVYFARLSWPKGEEELADFATASWRPWSGYAIDLRGCPWTSHWPIIGP